MQIKDFLAFYGDGEGIFGQLISDYHTAVSGGSASRLGEIMTRHGSDKATWHNYCLFYEILFGLLPRSPQTIFEVGIGTNDLEIVGNMGALGTPGASLRAWREMFPDAMIYGADYDANCLFDERNIRTFYLDQLDQSSINLAWSIMPHLRFDLVIDDGCHTYEANSTLLDATYLRLLPGGLYIIEDISMNIHNLCKFDRYLNARGWPAFLMRLPHQTNCVDNAIAVVRPSPPLPPSSVI
ncbi:class I SAM-dependent methyltransferase [Methylobacterium oxalidis]|uniref:Class I SAM-dependent methyltransferase n=1 Tax=Methylobacterium oxalidis TaxID=944322 RepID=A0A512IYA8_9HYPH|nr:class I SAM-dependent methyltransferase [Methylobacterium oxalidis]GEP02701.1 hypothetical protein MOX02_07390 [Methylobacterium oxalidis]GJE33593.1 hypothetical protein LDDCCGHA_3794 [Methylobacterium oxalidis]GLS66901.1 hypothetical protein GCM10007888_52840 [Methylobacterium oxalidis]